MCVFVYFSVQPVCYDPCCGDPSDMFSREPAEMARTFQTFFVHMNNVCNVSCDVTCDIVCVMCTDVYSTEGREPLRGHSAVSVSADGQKEEGRRTSAERRRSTETSGCSHTAHRRPEEKTERHRAVREREE